MERFRNFLRSLLKSIFPNSLLKEILAEEMANTRNEFYTMVIEGTTNHMERTLANAREDFVQMNYDTKAYVSNFNDEFGKLRKEMRSLGRPYIKLDAKDVINDYLAPMKNEFNQLREDYIDMKAKSSGANQDEGHGEDVASRLELRFTEHKKQIDQKIEYIIESLKTLAATAPAPTVTRKAKVTKKVSKFANKKVLATSKKKATKRK